MKNKNAFFQVLLYTLTFVLFGIQALAQDSSIVKWTHQVKKINEKQIENRRADVNIIEHNLILEFQHSKIDLTEVNNRMNDYELHNLKIIWIIDGNNSIKVTNLDYCNRIYLEFEKETWKYKSFISYDYIFIDINQNIYKVYPKI